MTKPTIAPLLLVMQYSSGVTSETEHRDQAIIRARECGCSFRQIADAAKMSPQGIRKIVAKSIDNSVDTDTIDI